MNQKKHAQYPHFTLLLVILAFFMLLPNITALEIIPDKLIKKAIFIKITTPPFVYIIRFLYIVAIPFTFGILTSPIIHKQIKKEDQPTYKKMYWILSIIIFIGFIPYKSFFFFNVIFIPLVMLIALYCASRGYTKIGERFDEETPLKEMSSKPIDCMGLVFTGKNPYGEHKTLHIHNPAQGLMVIGGAGAGKSASVLEPAIHQWIQNHLSLLIYDFKGTEAPLGRIAYNSWLSLENEKTVLLKGKEIVLKKPEFCLVSLQHLHKSSRPNPISPKLLSNTFHAKAVTDTLLIAAAPNIADKKGEFFVGSGLNLIHAIVERLRTSEELHKYCTLAHVVALATYKSNTALLNWLADKTESRAIISSFLPALEKGANEQLAGQIASLTNFIGILSNKEIFWILGAEEEKQTLLDINNPKNPKILCIANDPIAKEALSPVLSALIKSCINILNQPNKIPTPIVIDELPTLYIDKLAEIPATGRSNHLMVTIGLQGISQLKELYNKSADVITENMGNYFVGMTNNPETAKKFAESFGTFKKLDPSISIGESMSISEKLTNEKIAQERDISNQDTGHFYGKVAAGDPAPFSIQIDEFKKEEHFNNWSESFDIPPADDDLKLIFGMEDQETANKIFNEMLLAHYYKINLEAEEILIPYTPD